MRLQLDTEIPSNIQNMQYKTILACEYNKWFLVVDGGSGLWNISVYGTPFPTGTADQVKFLSSRGCYLHWVVSRAGIASLLSVQEKSGQDNSQGQASEYFECTRKHYEHRYNITMMCWKYFMLMTSVTKDKWNSDACKQVIYKNAITW